MVAKQQNIEAIYQQAKESQKGGAWNKIREIRSSVVEDIQKNIKAGGDNGIIAELAAVKKANPNMGDKEAQDTAIDNVVERRTRDEFVGGMKERLEQGGVAASFSNIGDLIKTLVKAVKLWSGSLEEKADILVKSNFLNDIGEIRDAWNESTSSGNTRGFFATFGEHARNARIANWLGIQNENEKKQFLADLNTESPVLIARATTTQQTPEQIDAARAERARIEQEGRDGKPTAGGGTEHPSGQDPQTQQVGGQGQGVKRTAGK